MTMIHERNIKMTNPAFLEDEAIVETGKIVALGEDGRLEWPVLFFYPQYSESDFIEAFHEDSKYVYILYIFSSLCMLC